MKKALSLIFALATLPACAQTYQLRAGAAIQQGQCVAIGVSAHGPALPCDNTVPEPLPVAGVALNTVTVPGNLVTIQYAGLVTVPVTTYYSMSPGDFIGDIDGSGDINDLGKGFCSCNGIQTYLGFLIGYTTAQENFIEIVVQPGYVATDINAEPDVDRAKKRAR